MRLDFANMTDAALEAAARHYEAHGYFILDGIDHAVSRHFRPLLAEMLGVSPGDMATVLDAHSPPVVLPIDVRRRLSRIETTPALADAVFSALEPVFRRLLGPIVHVSTTFHGQFKGGDAKPVDHGGYSTETQYMEVQGPYLIHQDFTGAAIPTSPCGLTLWVAQNSCPDWNLRLIPGSHRHGLLCSRWLALDDPHLAPFGKPVDVEAREGSAVIFNSLLLHASSNPGPGRRVSCDIRFFPLCGFLPSQPRVLGRRPMQDIRDGLARDDGPTLRAPLLEDLAFLGERAHAADAPRHSILNWANYLQALLHGDSTTSRGHFDRFVNVERGVDAPAAYASRYFGQPVHASTLRTARDRIGALDPGAPELAGLARLIEAADAVRR